MDFISDRKNTFGKARKRITESDYYFSKKRTKNNPMNIKSKEEKLWDYLVKTLAHLNDNNRTAKKIYKKVESLTPILFKVAHL